MRAWIRAQNLAVCVNLVASTTDTRALAAGSSILIWFKIEYLEWARAAPSPEPGQVREEAAIRDR
ncbi:hypothetical protein CE91St30_07290 [Raoultibacter timonensis]|uniref:Uncharacterized protein n=1 Tax=Raoultibacter timonensis TaxID=1907662 RepID=A0ABN6MGE2_9ACTN|nr:hypothetical protein CE91St30_07290 [Raoultibacter timonensis]BDF49999.1 hypothetical protein CE91St31_07290 [Raoultibacter timonensis]